MPYSRNETRTRFNLMAIPDPNPNSFNPVQEYLYKTTEHTVCRERVRTAYESIDPQVGTAIIDLTGWSMDESTWDPVMHEYGEQIKILANTYEYVFETSSWERYMVLNVTERFRWLRENVGEFGMHRRNTAIVGINGVEHAIMFKMVWR